MSPGTRARVFAAILGTAAAAVGVALGLPVWAAALIGVAQVLLAEIGFRLLHRPPSEPAASPSRPEGGSLVLQENLASLGRLASGVAHEFGNPLTTISSIAQLLARRRKGDDFVRQQAESIRAHVQRLSRLSRLLVDLAFPGRPEITAFDLGTVLSDTTRMARLDSRVRGVEIDLELPPDGIRVRADRGAVHLIVLNLLFNAADAMDGEGRLTISVDDGELGTEIRVTDEGPGIPEEIRSQVFSPFFTTKEPGRGTGLGLSISCRLARATGGELYLERSGEDGTCFLLILGPPEDAIELPDPRR
jgi:two-component system NtrC family sensor kinase